jgi:hypothetical protein
MPNFRGSFAENLNLKRTSCSRTGVCAPVRDAVAYRRATPWYPRRTTAAMTVFVPWLRRGAAFNTITWGAYLLLSLLLQWQRLDHGGGGRRVSTLLQHPRHEPLRRFGERLENGNPLRLRRRQDRRHLPLACRRLRLGLGPLCVRQPCRHNRRHRRLWKQTTGGGGWARNALEQDTKGEGDASTRGCVRVPTAAVVAAAATCSMMVGNGRVPDAVGLKCSGGAAGARATRDEDAADCGRLRRVHANPASS